MRARPRTPGGMSLSADMLEVPLDQIRAEGNIRNFRMDDESGRGLRDSVRSFGILQPVLLSPLPGPKANGHRYLLVAGFRRYSAACESGRASIPARIVRLDERQILLARLTENSQRLDPNPIEEARAIREYLTLANSSRQEVSRSLGKSEAWISSRLALLSLPDSIQQRILEGRLTSAQAAPLLDIIGSDPDRIRQAADLAEKGLSIYEIRRKIRRDNFVAAVGREPRSATGRCGPLCPCSCLCCQARRCG